MNEIKVEIDNCLSYLVPSYSIRVLLPKESTNSKHQNTKTTKLHIISYLIIFSDFKNVRKLRLIVISIQKHTLLKYVYSLKNSNPQTSKYWLVIYITVVSSLIKKYKRRFPFHRAMLFDPNNGYPRKA